MDPLESLNSHHWSGPFKTERWEKGDETYGREKTFPWVLITVMILK